jgi:hypothetical protein
MVFAGPEREISDLRGALGGASRLVLVQRVHEKAGHPADEIYELPVQV